MLMTKKTESGILAVIFVALMIFTAVVPAVNASVTAEDSSAVSDGYYAGADDSNLDAAKIKELLSQVDVNDVVEKLFADTLIWEYISEIDFNKALASIDLKGDSLEEVIANLDYKEIIKTLLPEGVTEDITAITVDEIYGKLGGHDALARLLGEDSKALPVVEKLIDLAGDLTIADLSKDSSFGTLVELFAPTILESASLPGVITVDGDTYTYTIESYDSETVSIKNLVAVFAVVDSQLSIDVAVEDLVVKTADAEITDLHVAVELGKNAVGFGVGFGSFVVSGETSVSIPAVKAGILYTAESVTAGFTYGESISVMVTCVGDDVSALVNADFVAPNVGKVVINGLAITKTGITAISFVVAGVDFAPLINGGTIFDLEFEKEFEIVPGVNATIAVKDKVLTASVEGSFTAGEVVVNGLSVGIAATANSVSAIVTVRAVSVESAGLAITGIAAFAGDSSDRAGAVDVALSVNEISVTKGEQTISSSLAFGVSHKAESTVVALDVNNKLDLAVEVAGEDVTVTLSAEAIVPNVGTITINELKISPKGMSAVLVKVGDLDLTPVFNGGTILDLEFSYSFPVYDGITLTVAVMNKVLTVSATGDYFDGELFIKDVLAAVSYDGKDLDATVMIDSIRYTSETETSSTKFVMGNSLLDAVMISAGSKGHFVQTGPGVYKVSEGLEYGIVAVPAVTISRTVEAGTTTELLSVTYYQLDALDIEQGGYSLIRTVSEAGTAYGIEAHSADGQYVRFTTISGVNGVIHKLSADFTSPAVVVKSLGVVVVTVDGTSDVTVNGTVTMQSGEDTVTVAGSGKIINVCIQDSGEIAGVGGYALVTIVTLSLIDNSFTYTTSFVIGEESAPVYVNETFTYDSNGAYSYKAVAEVSTPTVTLSGFKVAVSGDAAAEKFGFTVGSLVIKNDEGTVVVDVADFKVSDEKVSAEKFVIHDVDFAPLINGGSIADVEFDIPFTIHGLEGRFYAYQGLITLTLYGTIREEGSTASTVVDLGVAYKDGLSLNVIVDEFVGEKATKKLYLDGVFANNGDYAFDVILADYTPTATRIGVSVQDADNKLEASCAFALGTPLSSGGKRAVAVTVDYIVKDDVPSFKVSGGIGTELDGISVELTGGVIIAGGEYSIDGVRVGFYDVDLGNYSADYISAEIDDFNGVPAIYVSIPKIEDSDGKTIGSDVNVALGDYVSLAGVEYCFGEGGYVIINDLDVDLVAQAGDYALVIENFSIDTKLAGEASASTIMFCIDGAVAIRIVDFAAYIYDEKVTAAFNVLDYDSADVIMSGVDVTFTTESVAVTIKEISADKYNFVDGYHFAVREGYIDYGFDFCLVGDVAIAVFDAVYNEGNVVITVKSATYGSESEDVSVTGISYQSGVGIVKASVTEIAFNGITIGNVTLDADDARSSVAIAVEKIADGKAVHSASLVSAKGLVTVTYNYSCPCGEKTDVVENLKVTVGEEKLVVGADKIDFDNVEASKAVFTVTKTSFDFEGMIKVAVSGFTFNMYNTSPDYSDAYLQFGYEASQVEAGNFVGDVSVSVTLTKDDAYVGIFADDVKYMGTPAINTIGISITKKVGGEYADHEVYVDGAYKDDYVEFAAKEFKFEFNAGSGVKTEGTISFKATDLNLGMGIKMNGEATQEKGAISIVSNDVFTTSIAYNVKEETFSVTLDGVIAAINSYTLIVDNLSVSSVAGETTCTIDSVSFAYIVEDKIIGDITVKFTDGVPDHVIAFYGEDFSLDATYRAVEGVSIATLEVSFKAASLKAVHSINDKAVELTSVSVEIASIAAEGVAVSDVKAAYNSVGECSFEIGQIDSSAVVVSKLVISVDAEGKHDASFDIVKIAVSEAVVSANNLIVIDNVLKNVVATVVVGESFNGELTVQQIGESCNAELDVDAGAFCLDVIATGIDAAGISDFKADAKYGEAFTANVVIVAVENGYKLTAAVTSDAVVVKDLVVSIDAEGKHDASFKLVEVKASDVDVKFNDLKIVDNALVSVYMTVSVGESFNGNAVVTQVDGLYTVSVKAVSGDINAGVIVGGIDASGIESLTVNVSNGNVYSVSFDGNVTGVDIAVNVDTSAVVIKDLVVKITPENKNSASFDRVYINAAPVVVIASNLKVVDNVLENVAVLFEVKDVVAGGLVVEQVDGLTNVTASIATSSHSFGIELTGAGAEGFKSFEADVDVGTTCVEFVVEDMAIDAALGGYKVTVGSAVVKIDKDDAVTTFGVKDAVASVGADSASVGFSVTFDGVVNGYDVVSDVTIQVDAVADKVSVSVPSATLTIKNETDKIEVAYEKSVLTVEGKVGDLTVSGFVLTLTDGSESLVIKALAYGSNVIVQNVEINNTLFKAGFVQIYDAVAIKNATIASTDSVTISIESVKIDVAPVYVYIENFDVGGSSAPVIEAFEVRIGSMEGSHASFVINGFSYTEKSGYNVKLGEFYTDIVVPGASLVSQVKDLEANITVDLKSGKFDISMTQKAMSLTATYQDYIVVIDSSASSVTGGLVKTASGSLGVEVTVTAIADVTITEGDAIVGKAYFKSSVVAYVDAGALTGGSLVGAFKITYNLDEATIAIQGVDAEIGKLTGTIVPTENGLAIDATSEKFLVAYAGMRVAYENAVVNVNVDLDTQEVTSYSVTVGVFNEVFGATDATAKNIAAKSEDGSVTADSLVVKSGEDVISYEVISVGDVSSGLNFTAYRYSGTIGGKAINETTFDNGLVYYLPTAYFDKDGIHVFTNKTVAAPADYTSFSVTVVSQTVEFADFAVYNSVPNGTVISLPVPYYIDVIVDGKAQRAELPVSSIEINGYGIKLTKVEQITDVIDPETGVVKPTEGNTVVVTEADAQAIAESALQKVTIVTSKTDEPSKTASVAIPSESFTKLVGSFDNISISIDFGAPETKDVYEQIIEKLTQKNAEKVRNGTFVEVNVLNNGVKVPSENVTNLGEVTVSVDFDLNGRNADKLLASYIDEKDPSNLGDTYTVTYKDGKAYFSTTHFSFYLIYETFSSDFGMLYLVIGIVLAVLVAAVAFLVINTRRNYLAGLNA